MTNRTKTSEIIATLKKNGVTKWRISKLMNVSWQTVHMWDRGMFEPKPEKIEK